MRDQVHVEEIDSLKMNGNNVVGITNFLGDAAVTVDVNKGMHTMSTALPEDDYQSIKDYFSRPRSIGSGDLITSRASIFRTDITNPLTFWPVSAQNRLNGCMGFSADIKFTLVIASTPFQQSLVCLNWQYNTQALDGVLVRRSNYPALVTNLPHVNLDICESNMVELNIPYQSPWDFFELINTTANGGDGTGYSYGSIALTQLLPYQTLAGSSNPEYTFYVSLHNMQLFGAVPVLPGVVLPQSGISSEVAKERKPGFIDKLKKGKYISNGMHAVAIATPIVGAIAAGVVGNPEVFGNSVQLAWQAEALACTAAAMGYSKPTDTRPLNRVHDVSYAYDCNVDQPSPEFTVAPFQSNSLGVGGDQSATGVDELSLPYVLGLFAQAYVGDIRVSDTGGTVLYATNLCPTSMWFRTSVSRPGGNLAFPASSTLTTNAIQPTALCYISQMFRYWRGSIRFRFTFAKTKFHGGRVIAAYVPTTNDVTVPLAASNFVPSLEITGTSPQPFQYSTVFDLRDSNTFEFTVPYVSARPWISTFGSSGGVTLTVVDRLIASGETTTLVPYMVEVAAGHDFQLAAYMGSGLAPATGGGAQAAVVFQSGITDDSAYTMGEMFTSLKQLLMIPTRTAILNPSGTNDGFKAVLPRYWYTPLIANVVPFPPTASAPFSMAVQHVISRMYSFGSGATSYHIYSTGSDTSIDVSVEQVEGGGVTSANSFSDIRRRQSSSKPRVITSSTSGSLHAKVPSFQKVVRMPLNQTFASANINMINSPVVAGTNFCGTVPTYTVRNTGSTASNFNISYAASDDARLWGYVGPPVCWLPQSLQSVPVDSSYSYAI